MKGQLTVRQNRGGVFEGHDIWGMQYEDGSGESGWLINSRPEQASVHTYCWVTEEEEFLIVNVSDWPNFEDKREITTFGVKTDIGTAERSAIIAAIHHWHLTNHNGT